MVIGDEMILIDFRLLKNSRVLSWFVKYLFEKVIQSSQFFFIGNVISFALYENGTDSDFEINGFNVMFVSARNLLKFL